MAAHLWVLPWLSLIAGLATLSVAIYHTVRATEPVQAQQDGGAAPPGRASRLASLIFWLLLVAVGVVVELALGQDQGVDYAGARGLLLGSLGGAVLASIARRAGARPRTAAFIVVGVALSEMAAARLWLTHGEITGLTACALGTIAAAICLGPQGRSFESWTGAAGAALASLLALSMELGFTRAEQITEEYWPDIPMLLTAAAAIGMLAAAVIVRAGTTARTPVRAIGALLPVAAAAGMAWWACSQIIHDTTTLKILTAGLVAALLLFALLRKEDSSPSRLGPGTHEVGGGEERAGVGSGPDIRDGDRQPAIDGLTLVLIFAACAVAYDYWAGYGIAILLAAGWIVYAGAGSVGSNRVIGLVGPLAVGALIAAHRALSLQNDDAFSQTTIGDSWNLLALAAGAAIPLAVTTGRGDSGSGGFRSAVRTVAGTIGMVVLVCYLLATDATDGLLIGAALGLAASIVLGRATPAGITNSLFLAFVVLQGMPIMAQWKEPTRHVKVDLLMVFAVLAIVLALIPRKAAARQAEA